LTGSAHQKRFLLLFLLPFWIALYLLTEPLAGFLTHAALGLERGAPLGEAVRFFLYEVPKVLLLLTLIVFAVGIVRSFFSPERTRAALEGKSTFAGNVMAGTLGIVTPFCSCSAIPLFIGFVESGVPLGVTFSFLIAAPMINEVAVVLLLGLFGWKTALIYVAAGLSIAIGAGWVIGKLKLERWVEGWVYQVQTPHGSPAEAAMSWDDRLDAGVAAVRDIVSKVWMYILAGIAVGAGIHGYVPENFLASIMGREAWYSVPLSVLIGIPLYSNAAGIIPVVQALLEKGASLGTVLAFMMSVIGLSLPEMIILRKVLKLPLIALFCAVVGAGIILVGLIFNALF
jgi:hypothetical protein